LDLWFADGNVEAEVVCRGSPVRPVHREHGDPRHQRTSPQHAAYPRDNDHSLHLLLAREFCLVETFAVEPHSIDSPQKGKKCKSKVEVFCAKSKFLLLGHFGTL